MVRINLLGDKTDNTRVYAAQILAFVVSVLVTTATCAMLQVSTVQRTTLMKTEKSALETELANLKKVTAEVAELEKKQQTLRERIVTIANLKAKKHGPVHVLDDLNVALPERTWITSIKTKSGSLEIIGNAVDDQTVAALMRRLDESKYFGAIELVHSVTQDVEGVKLKQFSIMAEITNPFVRELPKAGPSVVPAAAPAAKAGAKAAKGGKKKLEI